MAQENVRSKLERWKNTAWQQLHNPSGIHVSDHDVKSIAEGVIWLLENTLLEDPDRLDSLKRRNEDLSEVNATQFRELEQLRSECARLSDRIDQLESGAVDRICDRVQSGDQPPAQVVE